MSEIECVCWEHEINGEPNRLKVSRGLCQVHHKKLEKEIAYQTDMACQADVACSSLKAELEKTEKSRHDGKVTEETVLGQHSRFNSSESIFLSDIDEPYRSMLLSPQEDKGDPFEWAVRAKKAENKWGNLLAYIKGGIAGAATRDIKMALEFVLAEMERVKR